MVRRRDFFHRSLYILISINWISIEKRLSVDLSRRVSCRIQHMEGESWRLF
jgi:hypothetical protein